ncbi:MAG: DUF5011 domain-containing protein [Ruminococcus sp.]|nr:DUF5011 domain-containing protein [Ruminococcus sp.]
MKKNLFVSLFCIILAFTCILCGFNGINSELNNISEVTETPTEEPTTQIATTAPQIVTEEKEPVQIEKGLAQVISLDENEESKLESWTSSDKNIVTVDSGGRIDALKEGTAKITASFSDYKKYEYEVTVTKASEKEKTDRYSTAITANQDILTDNIYDGSDRNPYYIYVNRQQNCVTVYTYDENGDYTIPVRAMICSCGKNNATILGDFTLYFKNEWVALYNNVYGHYVSGISGDYLFHSVPYETTSPDSLEDEEFNKLGEEASLGCVRMATADVKWIYENCPRNTKIKIYDDENAGPLGRPESIKITDTSCHWDPTDDNENNPYNKKSPKFSGLKDITIKQGETYSVLDGVKAVDTCSNDITKDIEVTGNVVTSRKGTYKVTYSVTDVLHRTTEKTITVTVK